MTEDKGMAEELSDAFGYLKMDEVALLKELVLSLPDDPLIVNIGCGVGTSGAAILECRDDSFLVSVDLHRQARPEGALGNERQVINKMDLLHRRVEIHSESVPAGLQWPQNNETPWFRDYVDMVFHDAAHGYQSLLEELHAWLPIVKKGGIIAVHDYESPVWGGVTKAVDGLLRSNHKFIKHIRHLIAFEKGD